MNKFVVTVFSDQSSAERAVEALNALHAEGAISLHGMALARKDAGGELGLTEKVGKGLPGAAALALAGGLVGLLGGPATAAIGAAGGAWIGTWRDIAHLGVGAEFLEDVARELAPGTTAVIADVTEERVTPVDERMEALGGIVLREWQVEYAEAQLATEAAARKAELEHLKAERSDAPAPRGKLLERRIAKAEARLAEIARHARERRGAIQEACAAKLGGMQAQAAGAGANAKASIERRIAETQAATDRRLALLEQALAAADLFGRARS